MFRLEYFLMVLFLAGCSFSKPEVFYSEDLHVKEKSTAYQEKVGLKDTNNNTKTIESKLVNGMIRGVIKNMSYVPAKGSWKFEVEAIDSSHGKLSKATFESTKGQYESGDLVYVVLKRGILQQMYLIQKRYHASKSETKVEYVKVKEKSLLSKKPKKRTKSRQTPWISIPDEETISLD